jgi:hypothetical protein
MEVHRLHLSITEQDLNDLAREHLTEETGIEDLEVAIKPEGVRVKGVYPIFVPVSFEALWELSVHKGRAMARLAHFRTLGMPTGVLKSLVMNLVADAAKKEPWLEVQGDFVLADLDGLLKKQGINAQTHLTAIHCEMGVIVVEAGEVSGPPASSNSPA